MNLKYPHDSRYRGDIVLMLIGKLLWRRDKIIYGIGHALQRQ
jgi:hypothetical protein